MAIKQKRDKGLKIMMTETMFNRLTELGELLGQSPSTLASMGVSNLINQYMGQERIQTGVINAAKETFSEMASNAKEAIQ